MTIQNKLVLLFAFGLLLNCEKAELTDAEINAVDFYGLLSNPKATGKDITKKVGRILKEEFNVDISPKNIKDAYLQYVTVGYGTFNPQESPENLEAQASQEVKEKVDEVFQKNNLEDFLVQ